MRGGVTVHCFCPLVLWPFDRVGSLDLVVVATAQSIEMVPLFRSMEETASESSLATTVTP